MECYLQDQTFDLKIIWETYKIRILSSTVTLISVVLYNQLFGGFLGIENTLTCLGIQTKELENRKTRK